MMAALDSEVTAAFIAIGTREGTTEDFHKLLAHWDKGHIELVFAGGGVCGLPDRTDEQGTG